VDTHPPQSGFPTMGGMLPTHKPAVDARATALTTRGRAVLEQGYRSSSVERHRVDGEAFIGLMWETPELGVQEDRLLLVSAPLIRNCTANV